MGIDSAASYDNLKYFVVKHNMGLLQSRRLPTMNMEKRTIVADKIHMTQQDKSWTRGERFSAMSLLLSVTGVTIALISASANKDIRCSIAHIDCNKPQPVIVVQPPNESKVPQNDKSELGQLSGSEKKTSLKPANQLTKEDTNAESIIYSYYQEINSRNYISAWNKLPTGLRENKEIHPKGMKSFVDFFTSVQEVSSLRISILNSTRTEAKIHTSFVYKMKSGGSRHLSLIYKVYKYSADGDWEIGQIM